VSGDAAAQAVADLLARIDDAWARVRACKHTSTQEGPAYGYQSSVAAYADDENPAAHGNITRVETCLSCDGTRRVNRNGSHEESSPWGADTEELKERLSKAREAERIERTLDAAERTAWRGDVLTVEGCAPCTVTIAAHRPTDRYPSEHVDVRVDDRAYLHVSISDIEGAARAPGIEPGQRIAWRLIARRAQGALTEVNRRATAARP